MKTIVFLMVEWYHSPLVETLTGFFLLTEEET